MSLQNLYIISQITQWLFKLKEGGRDYLTEEPTMESNNEVISRLKFIGRIKEGDKINIRHLYIQPEGLGTTLSRTFVYTDNRKNTLNFIMKILHRSFEIVTQYMISGKPSEKTFASHIVKDIEKCKKGIINLKATYKDDIMYCCTIDTLLQSIMAKLAEIYEKYPKMKENIEKEEETPFLIDENIV
jgi:hypothetical protein